jgi:hypothetical protein
MERGSRPNHTSGGSLKESTGRKPSFHADQYSYASANAQRSKLIEEGLKASQKSAGDVIKVLK